jgi:hypothetical protein
MRIRRMKKKCVEAFGSSLVYLIEEKQLTKDSPESTQVILALARIKKIGLKTNYRTETRLCGCNLNLGREETMGRENLRAIRL